MAMHTGSCGCGQIRITAGCDQQTVSGTYSVHAYFLTKHVRVKGTTKVYARRCDSGAYVYFHFCPECGTIIYWEIEARRGKTGPLARYVSWSGPRNLGRGGGSNVALERGRRCANVAFLS